MTKELFCQVMVEIGHGQPFTASVPTAARANRMDVGASVRYVVVHYDRISDPRRRELEAGMERYREVMPVVFRLGSDVVYEVRDLSDLS
jgi:hypothetical protein